jgi:hypothetical protein
MTVSRLTTTPAKSQLDSGASHWSSGSTLVIVELLARDRIARVEAFVFTLLMRHNAW